MKSHFRFAMRIYDHWNIVTRTMRTIRNGQWVEGTNPGARRLMFERVL
jgi:hypothetical protein